MATILVWTPGQQMPAGFCTIVNYELIWSDIVHKLFCTTRYRLQHLFSPTPRRNSANVEANQRLSSAIDWFSLWDLPRKAYYVYGDHDAYDDKNTHVVWVWGCLENYPSCRETQPMSRVQPYNMGLENMALDFVSQWFVCLDHVGGVVQAKSTWKSTASFILDGWWWIMMDHGSIASNLVDIPPFRPSLGWCPAMPCPSGGRALPLHFGLRALEATEEVSAELSTAMGKSPFSTMGNQQNMIWHHSDWGYPLVFFKNCGIRSVMFEGTTHHFAWAMLNCKELYGVSQICMDSAWRCEYFATCSILLLQEYEGSKYLCSKRNIIRISCMIGSSQYPIQTLETFVSMVPARQVCSRIWVWTVLASLWLGLTPEGWKSTAQLVLEWNMKSRSTKKHQKIMVP